MSWRKTMLDYLWAHKEYMIFWAFVWLLSFGVFATIMYCSVRSITTAIREGRTTADTNQEKH